MSETKETLVDERVKANLEIMESILSTNPKLLDSDSLSSINSIPNPLPLPHPQVRTYYPLVRLLLSNLHTPFKILPIYARFMMLQPSTPH